MRRIRPTGRHGSSILLGTVCCGGRGQQYGGYFSADYHVSHSDACAADCGARSAYSRDAGREKEDQTSTQGE
jgi:hypothetical protein